MKKTAKIIWKRVKKVKNGRPVAIVIAACPPRREITLRKGCKEFRNSYYMGLSIVTKREVFLKVWNNERD
jgi:hypothetical protein